MFTLRTIHYAAIFAILCIVVGVIIILAARYKAKVGSRPHLYWVGGFLTVLGIGGAIACAFISQRDAKLLLRSRDKRQ